MIATMKIYLQNIITWMKATRKGWQRCKYFPFSEIESYFCPQKYPGQGVRYWRGDFLPRSHFCTLSRAITRNIKCMDLQCFFFFLNYFSIFFKHLSWFVYNSKTVAFSIDMWRTRSVITHCKGGACLASAERSIYFWPLTVYKNVTGPFSRGALNNW